MTNYQVFAWRTLRLSMGWCAISVLLYPLFVGLMAFYLIGAIVLAFLCAASDYIGISEKYRVLPTDKGHSKYGPSGDWGFTGYYNGVPCTCLDDCGDCDGSCGCGACVSKWYDEQ